ncbi:MAG TPA: M1 family aminopeptidase, partial [Herpetosiphonaceae bacterium]|nr:M1 family aminopeptidase [Herpetosiphonaceae bacterium]
NTAGAGGMEYPTLITGGTLGVPSWGDGVTLVVSHEVAHQWWPMQTATNEAEEPWLDEGLTEYSGMRYMQTTNERFGPGRASIDMACYERAQYSAEPEEPATRAARDYEGLAYGSAVYSKPAVGLATLEQVVGTERMRTAMKAYLEAFRFRHPTAADFRASLETSLDQDLDWFFDDFLATGGEIDYAVGDVRQTGAGTEIRVSREGAVAAPVEVRVTLDHGEQIVREWDGSTQELVFNAGDASNRVLSVEVDPQLKLVAELDRLDNGRHLRPDIPAAAGVGGRLAFWMQLLGQLLGMAG